MVTRDRGVVLPAGARVRGALEAHEATGLDGMPILWLYCCKEAQLFIHGVLYQALYQPNAHLAGHYTPLRNRAVFLAIDLGWRTNCFPLRVPSLLALVVAAYSAAVKDLIAFSGKYLSPVFKEGLPDLVLHFCFDHALRLF